MTHRESVLALLAVMVLALAGWALLILLVGHSGQWRNHALVLAVPAAAILLALASLFAGRRHPAFLAAVAIALVLGTLLLLLGTLAVWFGHGIQENCEPHCLTDGDVAVWRDAAAATAVASLLVTAVRRRRRRTPG